MLPYWLLFSLFASGAALYQPEPHRRIQGGPYFLATCAVAILMVGLRYAVGGDWFSYVEMMEEASYYSLFEGMSVVGQDPGYAAINWLATRTGAGIWLVNLICALIFIWGITAFARRQPNPWLVVLVAVPYLIIVVGMGYTRQAVAIGLILGGLTQLDRGLLRFLLFIGVAAAFHKSAVVVLPLVALSVPHNRAMTIAVGAASTIVLYYVFLVASVDRLVTNYVEQGYASQGAGVRVAMNLPPAIIFLLFQRRLAAAGETRLWRNFAYASIATLFILFFTSATAAVDRIALYLIPIQMFVLGRLPQAFPERGRPSLTLTLAVIAYSATIQFVWLNYAVNAPSWLPYQFYITADEWGRD